MGRGINREGEGSGALEVVEGCTRVGVGGEELVVSGSVDGGGRPSVVVSTAEAVGVSSDGVLGATLVCSDIC